MLPKHRPLEKTFQAKVTKRLKTLKNTWFYKSSDRNYIGVPDIIICSNGTFIGLELKRDEKAQATEIQQLILKRIADAGGMSAVVHPGNWEKIWTHLEIIAGGTK